MTGLKRLMIVLLAMVPLAGTAIHGQIGFELVTDGLDTALYATHSRDGSGRLFIVSQTGTIQIWDGNQVLPELFLDLTDQVLVGGATGLLGLAFHPDYANNGRFFVHYSGLPDGQTVLSGFQVSPLDPNLADPDSERIMFTHPQPFDEHNGGMIAFGPNDGFLYVALGDGGSIGDPDNRAQDLSDPLGKILRFDVDLPPPHIPASNPFVGVPDAREEIWAYGLRNPWRFSFDRLTGDMFIGDVGQDTSEEVSFQPGESTGGENYGWRLMEGSECFDPPVDCDDGTLELPIMEYPHFDEDGFFGCSVTGGYMYRGSAMPELQGTYFFGDFCTSKIFAAEEDGLGNWTYEEVVNAGFPLFSFGEDEVGELYAVGGFGLWRVVESDTSVTCSIATDQAVYNVGDTMIISTLEVVNDGPNVEAIEMQVRVDTGPGRPWLLVLEVGADGTVTVDPGETLDFAPLELRPIPPGVPAMEYGIGCRVMDPDTGTVYGEDLVNFEVQ